MQAAVPVAAVFAAAYHAEVVVHRVGEPFGTPVPASAATVIEVAPIVSVMLGGGPGSEALARDTVFAAVMIAAVVPPPEGPAAFKAARANRLQTGMNLALGSALAGIGLTVPAVAAVSVVLGRPLAPDLGPKEEVPLALGLPVGVMALGTGRTTVPQGIVHPVIPAAFLALAVVPWTIAPAVARGVGRAA